MAAGYPKPRVAGTCPARLPRPEPLQRPDFFAEARDPVLQPVGERADREAAVAPAGAEADRLRLQQDDLAARVVGLREERRPEPGEAAADDAEVRLDLAAQGSTQLAWAQRGEPV